MIILGIDPGTQTLGYGAVCKEGSKITYVTHGQLQVSAKLNFLERLGLMSEKVADLIQKIAPQAVAIERIFLGRNVDSAFKLGHIRGVCLFESHKVSAPVFEYTPRLVKQGITGSGSATKEQVQLLLFSQLQLRTTEKSLDASDGLALAFYHALQVDVLARLRGTGVNL